MVGLTGRRGDEQMGRNDTAVHRDRDKDREKAPDQFRPNPKDLIDEEKRNRPRPDQLSNEERRRRAREQDDE